MSNGTSIASKSSPHESETDTCQPPRSSLTCVSSFSPVQPSSIEDLRTWLAQVSPVSRSPLRGSKQEPMTSGTCGQQQPTLFASYSLNPFCLKTCQDLFQPDTLEPSLVTWPRWGMWGDGELLAQETAMPRTSATDCGLWLTPCATDANPITGGNLYQTETGSVRARNADGTSSNRGLQAQAMWPTPRANSAMAAAITPESAWNPDRLMA